jgi:hypothetical protein
MVARNQASRKRAGRAERLKNRRVIGLLARGAHVLGAPGRARAAHIMQFRPVGVERPGEEGAPEGAEFGKRLFCPGVAGGGTGVGNRSDRGHDAGPVVFTAAFAALGAFRRAENELWPDSLKVGFNCRNRCRYGVSPVFIRGERRENDLPAVALWRLRRYVSDSKFSPNPLVSKGSRWRASSSISCRV